MMHGYGIGWLPLVGLLGWVVLIGATGAVLMVLDQRRRSSAPDHRQEPPLDVLERRFACGEIGADEFDEARARLREPHG